MSNKKHMNEIDGPGAGLRSAELLVDDLPVERPRGFCCRECGGWFCVFHAVADEAEAARAEGHVFAMECPLCKHSDQYSTSELVDGVSSNMSPPRKPVRPRR